MIWGEQAPALPLAPEKNVRIVAVREKPVAISRYADPSLGPAQLTTSLVAVVTDVPGDDGPLTGYGFASIGRFAQSGLIAERFALRLLNADPAGLLHQDMACIDPMKAWSVMMQGEKPGGHGERSVAAGTLDMALWDLAAKFRRLPLHRLLAETFAVRNPLTQVPVYAGGGYYFPDDDLRRLKDEAQYFRSLGLDSLKIKIGAAPLAADLKRIETVLSVVGSPARVAVDAMNMYDLKTGLEAARALAPYRLRWFEDICDPLDFETHRAIVGIYTPPISAGEALFSLPDARNLLLYSRLRAGHDVLTFDPAHCYGIPEYARIVAMAEAAGWSRTDFLPHGGHLYGLHVAAGLGLGGCECNPHNFQPFGGFSDGHIIAGMTSPPDAPGIGFETRAALIDLFRALV
jgi:L-alanine-DL-glutamate epimerase-like enolase superfamily enzyme